MSVDITVKTVTPDPVPPPPQFQITLSLEAARALHFLSGRTSAVDIWEQSLNTRARYNTSRHDIQALISGLYTQLNTALSKD